MSKSDYIIYVIEDDVALNKLIQRKIADQGLSTKSSFLGKEVLVEIPKLKNKNCLLIIDYNLRDMNAKELIKKIHKIDSTIPFIVITGDDHEEIAIEMTKLGAKDFITKNSNFLTILPTIVNRTIKILDTQKLLLTTEEKFHTNEINLLTTLNSIGEAVISTDLSGNIIRMNPVAEKLTGWTLIEAVGKQFNKIFIALAEYRNTSIPITYNVIKKNILTKNVNSKITLTNKVGKIFPISFQGNIIKDESGKSFGLVLTFNDISQEIKRDAQLRQSQKLESIGLLAGGIAHDFNNILGSILGYTNILKETLPPNSNEINYLNSIVTITSKASDITSQLLSFSKQHNTKNQTSSIHDIINEVILILRHTFNKKIKIIADLDAENDFVKGDNSQLQQVFINLAFNSRDAMPNGGIITYASKNIVPDADFIKKHNLPKSNTLIEISISDTGTGISKSELSRIFEPFFTTKDKEKGTGLGLATVYGCIQKQKGVITVQSKLKEGTTFKIYFPIIKKSKKIRIDGFNKLISGSGNILIIDDDIDMLKVTSLQLESLGYSTISANISPEGVEIYKKKYKKIDLVILDMNMPHYNGLECFKLLRTVNQNVKCILSTGYSGDELLATITKEGIKGIIQKPFTKENLSKIVQKILKSS